MPVELNIIESATTLDTTVVTVVLESASEPGPAGPGVPTGGTAGQVLTKDSGTDYDTSWQDATGGGGGAPTTVDYLVGTASGSLSAEIVVGTSPGGELGGTWASPTVDATHSGSSHADVQAAAEATAASALTTHSADTTAVHGIADTSALALTANHPSNATFNDHSARHENGGADEIDLTGLSGIPADAQPLDSDLTAIAALTTTAFGRGLLELANAAALLAAAGAAAASHAHAGEDITSGTVADARIASTIARDSEVTSAISTHEADTTSVHGITDTSTLYRAGGTDVALADGGTGASLADPGADRVMFWDDSAGAVDWLTMGTNLTITGTTLDAASGGSAASDNESLILHMAVFA